MSTYEHKKQAPKQVGCKIITVSDTRTKETDKSGQLIIELLQKAGHKVIDYVIVEDEQSAIKSAVLNGCHHDTIDVILTNGGTGIAKRDVTIETVQPLFEKEIVGFGELFRMLSYTEDIGSAAILSRAVAGVIKNKAVFSMPGSSGAVRLAVNKLIIPELGHVVRELRKDLSNERL
ncbi:molybdenum cofactor biosynthesis protein MoaB [Bacillus aquiflavi]|uniref:Molybdenum cofactor biosynthesis protein B n=1 Tax=Bacillus aquiflavi TaxID=2672567 RepID=A0A6B3W176_9BACI|nr:molybdenum cofactor biosynthesis protein B [Bacillus aquiflavi]MBA4537961.1 molybdenum cofactor biosynthesis protein MoaB [Bacillus aquiflavi]NEY82217.1 molybdenum cofactor biosynthesis protein MoaB [Bacillus aquiflavi]